jgi:hypothetical protein
MSVKEVPTILRKIAWSMRRADGDELKWLEEVKVKVERYNKLGQRDTDKLQVLYRDGLDGGLKVTTGGSVPENHEANTIIKSQRRRKDPNKIPKEKLPIWDGTIGKPIGT